MAQAPRPPLSLKPASANPPPALNAIAVDPSDPLASQYAYVEKQKAKGSSLGLVFVDAFIRGMREIGYKNPAWALAELVDNSFQAGARTIDIRFYGADLSKERSRPEQIAIVDDGVGMINEMIGHAVRWGGTHREGDRRGFGRYGYGLPSAAVSLARRYTVYSKTERTAWHAVTVDLDELADTTSQGLSVEPLLVAIPKAPPNWVGKEAKLDPATLKSGTVVVLEDLDRLHTLTGWVAAKTLQLKLLQHFGVIYRHWLNNKQIFVSGEKTGIIDPLFLLPLARYADETKVRAKQVATSAFEMEGRFGKGAVRIRASVLPPDFQLVDPNQYGVKGSPTNRRFDIMKQYNGILVCRAGRQIDVVQPDWTKFQNYDFNIKIEVDFDPELDEFFGLTTSKQQIVIDDRMWEKLKQKGKSSGGLEDLVKDMRRDFTTQQRELAARSHSPKTSRPRASAVAMQAAQKFKSRGATPSPQKAAEAAEELNQFAAERAKETGEPVEQVKAALVTEIASRPFEVEFVAQEEAPLYRGKRLGLQKRLQINTAHPFYEKIYQVAGDAKPGLEVFLFVLADAELDAEGDREQFYKSERPQWSEGLRHALEELMSDEEMKNRAAAESESSES